MISSKNIFYHELIGLELKVVDSSNNSLIGISGIVIDETKKTFLIEVKGNVVESKYNEIAISEDFKIAKSYENKINKSRTDEIQESYILSSKEKLIPKDVSIFQFKVPDGTIVEIDGKILMNRPEDRIKKRYKKI